MKYFIADAFAEKLFTGNPAGVCVMEEWLPEKTMEAIAMENNLSETAFAVREGDIYGLRWFTPGGEVSLCGHATLGAAFIISKFYDPGLNPIKFKTLSGILTVTKKGELYELDFPAYKLKETPVTPAMEEAVGMKIQKALLGEDLVCVVENEDMVNNAKPDFGKIAALPDGLGLHLTAEGKRFDCVTRCFFPRLGINEDPVTGRAHCHVIPYWAEKLGKNELIARQASARGGTLLCRMGESRVYMAGYAVLYLEGEINF
jgi:PhzF family phenazine biosynthesis protein